MEREARESVDKAIALQAKLAQFEDPQVELALLRLCGSCKVSHLLRAMPRDLAAAVFDHFDSSMLAATDAALACSLTPAAWQQARLPVSRGGLGLRSSADIADAAFIGSCNGVRKLVGELLGRSAVALCPASNSPELDAGQSATADWPSNSPTSFRTPLQEPMKAASAMSAELRRPRPPLDTAFAPAPCRQFRCQI